MLDFTTRTLACWRYGTPGVVLGAGQRTTPELTARAAAHGIDVVKRDSGGGAVMTGPWMLGFSLRLAPSDPATLAAPLEIFRLLGAACRDALGELGVSAALATDAEVARSSERARVMNLLWACFGTVSHGELVDSAGRKMLGLAQCRRRGGVLLEGGLLLGEPDWALLCELFGKPAKAGLALRDATAPLAERDSANFDSKAFDAGLRRGVARHLSRPRGSRVLLRQRSVVRSPFPGGGASWTTSGARAQTAGSATSLSVTSTPPRR